MIFGGGMQHAGRGGCMANRTAKAPTGRNRIARGATPGWHPTIIQALKGRHDANKKALRHLLLIFRLPPLQGLIFFTIHTRGYTPGYPIMPRWGCQWRCRASHAKARKCEVRTRQLDDNTTRRRTAFRLDACIASRETCATLHGDAAPWLQCFVKLCLLISVFSGIIGVMV